MAALILTDQFIWSSVHAHIHTHWHFLALSCRFCTIISLNYYGIWLSIKCWIVRLAVDVIQMASEDATASDHSAARAGARWDFWSQKSQMGPRLHLNSKGCWASRLVRKVVAMVPSAIHKQYKIEINLKLPPLMVWSRKRYLR